MKKVPNIISTKDLSYLEDMFNWNFYIAKKAYNYADLVNDNEIKKHFEKIYKNHKKICEDIVKYLGGNNA